MPNNPRNHCYRALGFAFGVIVAAPALAVEFTLDVGGLMRYTDNILATNTNELEEVEATGTVAFGITHSGSDVDLSIQGDASFRTYLKDNLDDQEIYNLTGDLTWFIIPDGFSWIATSRITDSRTNPNQPVTPINRETVRAFSTGPDMLIKLGSVADLVLEGRYGESRFEVSLNDSKRLGGAGRLVRDLSPISNVSLNAEATDVEFTEPLAGNTDFEQLDGFAGYLRETSISRLELAAGVSRIELATGRVLEEPLARILAERTGDPWSWNLRLEAGYTDAARQVLEQDALTLQTEIGTGQLQFSTGDPFYLKVAEVTGTWAGATTSLQGVVYYLEREFATDVFNDDRTRGIDLIWTRQMNTRTVLSAGASYARREIQINATEDEDRRFNVTLSRTMTDRLTITLFGQYLDRRSNLQIRNFDAYSVGAGFLWSVL